LGKQKIKDIDKERSDRPYGKHKVLGSKLFRQADKGKQVDQMDEGEQMKKFKLRGKNPDRVCKRKRYRQNLQT
jgi:hypothetical protein